MSSVRTVCFGVAVLSLAGCHSLGPKTITNDRIDYSQSIGESWKHQILLNIVKLRYMDTPVFLDVSQIVSGYTLETGIRMGGSLSPQNWDGDTFVESSVSGTYTDRPTITYTPMTGEDYLRGLLDPIPNSNLFYLFRSGFDAEFLLGLGLESINGINNYDFRSGYMRPAEPNFRKVISLLQELQDGGAVGVQMCKAENKERKSILYFRSDNKPDEVILKIREVKKLLGLKDEQQQFSLVYSPMRSDSNNVSVGCRSIIQVLSTLSTCVEVPDADIEQNRTASIPRMSSEEKVPIRILSSETKPEDAFVTVPYRDRWFWVEDQDWQSKRTISVLQFLFTLNDKSAEEHLPQITIPTN